MGIFQVLNPGKGPKIYYVVEKADWSIRWDGVYISSFIKKLYHADICVVDALKKVNNSLIHFGSRNLCLPAAWKDVPVSNKLIFTWFHGTKDDLSPENQAMIESVVPASQKVALVHVSCTVSKNRLANWGVAPDKIVLIPLGVELSRFRPLPDEKVKFALKRELGLPENKICIGSFQKDGNGWGEGNDPKLIKGPDIFCEAVVKLSKSYPLHILLTGPARGFVKNRLTEAGIPFTHVYLKNYLDIVKYYQAIDIYLVTSREEGGPKAILEGMATGIPVVSTRVGMAVDVIAHGENGFMADIGDTLRIVEYAARLIEDRSLYRKIAENGLQTVRRYDWEIIAGEYYKKLYAPLLAR